MRILGEEVDIAENVWEWVRAEDDGRREQKNARKLPRRLTSPSPRAAKKEYDEWKAQLPEMRRLLIQQTTTIRNLIYRRSSTNDPRLDHA